MQSKNQRNQTIKHRKLKAGQRVSTGLISREIKREIKRNQRIKDQKLQAGQCVVAGFDFSAKSKLIKQKSKSSFIAVFGWVLRRYQILWAGRAASPAVQSFAIDKPGTNLRAAETTS